MQDSSLRYSEDVVRKLKAKGREFVRGDRLVVFSGPAFLLGPNVSPGL
jgi:hypothetical protein